MRCPTRAAAGGAATGSARSPALSLLAVLGGATSPAKITRFIAGYDPDLRARAGLPGTGRLAASTLGRLLARLDGDAFDTATGKKVQGRKRHVIVDCLGLLLVVLVTAASVQDRDGARPRWIVCTTGMRRSR